MIEQIEGAPAGVVALKAVGEVGIDDYTEALKPGLDAAMAGGPRSGL